MKSNRSESLVIASRFQDLEDVVERAREFFSSVSDSEEFVYTAVLLTSEAVSNAIEHGNGQDESKKVYIDFVTTEDTYELWVEDQGPGFSPVDLEDPLAEKNLLAEGGRGIFLIEQLAHAVEYEKGGRRIGMIFDRNRVPD